MGVMYVQVGPVGTTRVNFRIPDELIEKADIAATITHKNRTELVTEAFREYLNEIEDEAAFREDLVDMYLDDEIEYDVLAAFLGRQDAEAVRASKSILEHGEELSDDLAGL